MSQESAEAGRELDRWVVPDKLPSLRLTLYDVF